MAVDKKIKNELSDILIDIQIKYSIFIDWQVEYKSYLNTNVANMMPWLENIKREGLQNSFEGRQRSRC